MAKLPTLRSVYALFQLEVYLSFTFQVDERAPSPEAVLLRHTQENVGPSEDDDAEFAKELARLVTDSADNRKVDKKTALSLWESTVPPPILRKKRGEDGEGADDASNVPREEPGVMKFTLFTKRGNKPQVYFL